MQKVLHVITRLDRGGSAKILLNLAEGLKKRGIDVSIITGPSIDPEEDIYDFSERTGIPVKVIPYMVRNISPIKDFLTLVSLIRFLRWMKPNVLHTHTSKAGFIGRIAGRLSGVSCIIHTPHGHTFYGYSGGLMSWFYIQLERFAACFCDRIITITSLERKDYIRLNIGDGEKIETIHCGINLKNYFNFNQQNFDIKGKLSINKATPLVGWIGRLEEIKGCSYFLEACKIVEKDIKDVRFLMVGEGPLYKNIKREIEKNSLNKKFFLTGYREDVPEIMRGIDIFVLTSLNEGLGLVLIEAMAAGRPVVATNVGGVPEIVLNGITGILTHPEKPESTANAIKKLLCQPELAMRMGEAGRERAKLFHIDKMIDRYLSLYNKKQTDRF